MPSSPGSLVDRFRTKFESLRGYVHEADSWDAAVQSALEVCRGAEATCVALGETPEPFRAAFVAACEGDGIRVLHPPYDAAALPGAIDEAQVGITWIDFAIARTGTLVETALDDATRLASGLPRTHIGMVSATSFIEELADAAPRMRETFSTYSENCTISFLSGPSRTGDIEMRLTLGVHGPESAHALVLAESLAVELAHG